MKEVLILGAMKNLFITLIEDGKLGYEELLAMGYGEEEIEELIGEEPD